MRSEPTRWRGGSGGSGTPAGLRQALTGETWEELGEVTGKGRRVAAANASPHLYRHGGGWWLALQGPRVIGQRGRKEIPPFLPHRSLSPLFRDPGLIPLGYDTIPFKGGSWCA